ncbi:OmpP1/FadL family transporter [Adhaeribacter soli]|uniref:Transporter n=1 Tax=Adhaeribacter soli TaxID=2607655 RepID=A0A5N1J186_9BACT|nr:OmpP1/FadL family transporter [Adhaeribacter soli]KAA9340168.1 transporter [Adhaeribacter soli]
MKRKLMAVLGSVLLSGAAQAGGFQVNLQGQKQIGMGHTGTGLALDEASVFFNPGAMSHLRENGFQIGVSGIISKIAYLEKAPGNATAESDNPLGTPFAGYGVYGKDESPLKFGLGVYTPFGSSVKWGNQWIGRFGLNELTLQAIFIQPTVSYKIGDKVGIGAGFVYSTGMVNLKRNLPVQNGQGEEGSIELDGRASGFGFNAGIFFQPTEKLSVGVTYRSKVEMEVEGGDVTNKVAPSLANRFPNTEFDATLPLPSNITLGLGFKPTEKLTLAADVQRVNWSAYEKLRFDFKEAVGGNNFTESARNYEDVYIYRLGAQYQVTDAFALRAGGYYDNTPVQAGYLTPETPDANAIGISGGLGYKFSDKFQVDASFLYITKEERFDEADKSGGIAGTYKTNVYIPGLALSYKF